MKVPTQGSIARLLDVLMVPLMYLLSGAREKPQRTHRWNNLKLKPEDTDYLRKGDMVLCEGIAVAKTRTIFGIPLFHMPIFGGWRDYTVLEPIDYRGKWHVGWIADDSRAVSMILIDGPVRVLIGSGDVAFFGVTPEGEQLRLCVIGRGRIGDGGSFAQIPLL